MGLRNRSGYWNYEFMADGVRYSGNTNVRATAKDKPKAKRIEDEAKQEVNSTKTIDDLHQSMRRQLTSGAQIKLEDAWRAYKASYRKMTAGAAKEDQYLSYLNDFMFFLSDRHKGVVYMHEVTHAMALEYMGHLQHNGRWHKTKTAANSLAASTLNTALDFLKRLFRVLHDRAGLVANPFDDIDRVESDKRGTKEIYNADELKIVADTSRENYPHLFHLFMVGFCTGLRRKDICLLEIDEVDLLNRVIETEPNKTIKKGVVVAIPLVIPGFYEYLSELIAKHPRNSKYLCPKLAEYYSRKYGSNQLSNEVSVFLKKKCGFVTQKKIVGRDRVICSKGIHSLRHTFIYLAAKARIPMNIVQGIVGHMDEQMTRFYADHATLEDKMNMMKTMPNLLLSSPELQGAVSTQRVDAILMQVSMLSKSELNAVSQSIQSRLASM